MRSRQINKMRFDADAGEYNDDLKGKQKLLFVHFG